METGFFSSKRILLRDLTFRGAAINRKIYAPDYRRELDRFFPHSAKLYKTVKDLFAANEGQEQAIFLHSHISRMTQEDAIEIRQRGLKSGLVLFANQLGEMYFYLLYTPGQELRGKTKKLKSTGDNYGDAKATQQMLMDFITTINVQGIQMYEPTKQNPRVILTKEDLYPIATSEKENLLGIILEPDVGKKTLWARGKVRFLAKNKQL